MKRGQGLTQGEHYPHLFVYLREREEMKRLFREQFNLSPKQYERCWQQILREGVKSGEFRPALDLQVVSYGLLGMLNWLCKSYDPRGRLGVREVADQLSTLALAGLAAAAPRARSPRTRAITSSVSSSASPAMTSSRRRAGAAERP